MGFKNHVSVIDFSKYQIFVGKKLLEAAYLYSSGAQHHHLCTMLLYF